MNLLKEIAVTGTIHPTHARLSLQFVFHNPTAHPLSPTYLFPFPLGASITGMQLLTKEKTILRADISPITEADTKTDGYRLVQLDSQLYSLTWECLPAGDCCTIIFECLLHLQPLNGRCRFILPFSLPMDSGRTPSPCPVNLDLTLENLEPLHLSFQDSFDSNTGTFSTTTQTNTDFVLDLTVRQSKSQGLLQEEFGAGCGFARLFFPPDAILNQSSKSSILLLLDLSHATTLRIGNSLKELFFRIYSALPDKVSIKLLTTGEPIPENLSKDALYHHLQKLSAGTGSLEELLQAAMDYQGEDTITFLVSTGSYLPTFTPDFSFILTTTGSVRQTTLSHTLPCEHLHFYPSDDQERELSHLIPHLLSPVVPIDVVPEDGNVHDCMVFSESGASDGYLDLAFSYSGRPPKGFALWQDGQKKFSIPLLQTNALSRFPDAEQLFAVAKIHRLSKLLELATPVSGRSIKKELTQLQTKFRILGSETILVLPTAGASKTSIPASFYSAANGFSSLANRPTIFGEGVRSLPQTEREQLADRCRQVIYESIRSNGSIRSPLGITPHVSAEETALSYLALLSDGRTDSSILQDALTYLNAAPETPWSFLIHSGTSMESLQKILPSLPAFETLLDSLGDSLPLMTATYLLLWLSLM